MDNLNLNVKLFQCTLCYYQKDFLFKIVAPNLQNVVKLILQVVFYEKIRSFQTGGEKVKIGF